MALSLVPSPSRKGPSRLGGGAGMWAPSSSAFSGDTRASFSRGALSGTMGASPFGILATAPDLPVSTVTSHAASNASISPATANRHSHAGLSLRRVNSKGGNALGRSVSGSVAPLVATSTRKVAPTLRHVGIALITLQLLLACVLFARPSWVHRISGVVKSSPDSLHKLRSQPQSRPEQGAGDKTEEAAYKDGSSTIAIISKIAADSRRSAATGSWVSRRERMWISSAGALSAEKKAQVPDHVSAVSSPSINLDKAASVPKTAVIEKTATAAFEPKTQASASATEAATTPSKPKEVTDNKAVVASIPPAKEAAVVKRNAEVITSATAVASAGKTQQTSQLSSSPFAKPVVPYAGRIKNPPPIVGVVFYGRRDRVRILDCYLQRNMAHNGGLLTSVVFVTATWQPDDVAFLDHLLQIRKPDYKKLYPERLDKGYTGHYAWMNPGTMYVKIDDDVVYIADHAIDLMLAAHSLNRYHLISANVINHQPLEHPHSQCGAHTLYEQKVQGDKSSWRPVTRQDTAGVLQRVPYVDNGWDVWGDWRRAANVHYSFLDNHAAGQLDLYDFPNNEQLWDFNAHVGYTRWRINMIMFKGATIDVHVYNMSSTVGTYPGDDEDYITRILPQQLNRTSAAVSGALAVHFSFYMQRSGLENSTDLLDRYTLLADKTCGQLVSL